MLWIWDVKRDYLLANLVFVSPVVAFQWNPVELELAVVTTNQTLYFWKQGKQLLLVGNDSYQLCTI